jgi:2-methylcitrate dehydratase PrpD
MSITGDLVDLVLGVRYDDLGAVEIDTARQVCIDGIGVTIAGYTEPLGLGRIVVDYVRDAGGNPQASVIAGGFRTSIANAAFANGTMAHALDFDNTWHPMNHPTSPTLPAILALAEHFRLPGWRVLEAVVAAFEVQARLRMASTGLHTGKGFHKPGTTGIMGATAAAVKLLDLDRAQALMAFGIAGSRAGSLSLNTGTMTKSSHSGHAARMGAECGLLAARGFTATDDVFGPKGFFETLLRDEHDAQLLTKDFGRPYRMADPGVGFKKYPSNYFTHRGIDAAITLRAEHGLDPAEISSVSIAFPALDYVNRPSPKTGLDGKFSVQYTVAAALLDGAVTVETFTNERRFAGDVQALLPRVELVVDESIPPEFDTMHIRLTVRTTSGAVYEQRVDKLSGMQGVPLKPGELEAKFMGCATRVFDPDRATRLLRELEGIDKAESLDAILALARGDDA